MMYPMPYPSAATGPNPNRRNAGFPQFDVDSTEWLMTCHPGSVKTAGRAGAPAESRPLEPEVVLVGDVGRSSASAASSADCARASRSRWRRQ